MAVAAETREGNDDEILSRLRDEKIAIYPINVLRQAGTAPC